MRELEDNTMAKKHGLAKIVLGVGAAAVAGKVAFDKFKQTKERFAKEENDSFDDEIRKYNAIGEKKVIEVEDEVFAGCELKAVASKAVLDLGLAVFEKDVYINFSSNASSVTIILPEGVNATCDISRKIAGVKNLVDNVDEEGIHTVYIIGKAVCSNVEVFLLISMSMKKMRKILVLLMRMTALHQMMILMMMLYLMRKTETLRLKSR